MIFKFSVFVLLFASQAFAKNFIIGGQDVKPTDPIQASTVGLFDPSPDGKSGSLCSGTLIRKDIAVTAAHCLEGGGAKPSLIFGRNLHSKNATRREVEAVAINPKYKARAGKGMDQGDIALVKFKGGLPKGYRAVPTVSSDNDIKKGDKVTLAGYGISNSRTKEGAGKLRRADVRISNNRPKKSEMILDQSHGRGACHGDSGGPAYLKRGSKIKLAGVTNRGYPSTAPDDCAHKVVYTKLSAYRSWIQKSESKLEQTKLSRSNVLRRSLKRVPHQRVHLARTKKTRTKRA